MYAYNSSLEGALSGLTSKVFHTLMWIFVASGIVGNVLVVFWRLSNKKLRYSILSLLIVSLAVADLLWCSHQFIQEVMLLNPLYFSGKSDNYSLDGTNKRLCLTVTFLTYLSVSSSILTAVAIAMYTFCTLACSRRRRFFVVYTLLVWIGAFTVATAALVNLYTVWNDPERGLSEKGMSLNSYIVKVVYSCSGFNSMLVIPLIGTAILALSSLAIAVIYCSLCLWLRTRRAGDENSRQKSQIMKLKIRLGIIAVINVVSWWPACIVHWYGLYQDKTIMNGKLPPSYPQSVLLLTAALSAANPLIYTVQLARLWKKMLLVFGFKCSSKSEELNLIDTGEHSVCKISCFCCVGECCATRRYPYRMSSFSDNTQEESLFPE